MSEQLFERPTKRSLVGYALQIGADIMHQEDATILEKPDDIKWVTDTVIELMSKEENQSKYTYLLAREIIERFRTRIK